MVKSLKLQIRSIVFLPNVIPVHWPLWDSKRFYNHGYKWSYQETIILKQGITGLLLILLLVISIYNSLCSLKKTEIYDILDLSKVEAGKSEFQPSSVDLKILLESSLTMVKEKALKHEIADFCRLCIFTKASLNPPDNRVHFDL